MQENLRISEVKSVLDCGSCSIGRLANRQNTCNNMSCTGKQVNNNAKYGLHTMQAISDHKRSGFLFFFCIDQ